MYGDIEVEDFNDIFNNQDIIRDRYGKSLQVRLFLDKRSGHAKREVFEDLSQVRNDAENARDKTSDPFKLREDQYSKGNSIEPELVLLSYLLARL